MTGPDEYSLTIASNSRTWDGDAFDSWFLHWPINIHVVENKESLILWQ